MIRLAESYPPVAVQPRRGLSRLGRVWFGDRATATGHAEFDPGSCVTRSKLAWLSGH